MLFEDLELIINGVHLMSEEEIAEFVKTRSLVTRAKKALNPMSDYSARKRELMKQRKVMPYDRKVSSNFAAGLRSSGRSSHIPPDQRRARADYKRPERGRKADVDAFHSRFS